jgi:hypothetical protein
MAGRIRRLSPAMIVACIALAVALGGVGYAATVLPANSVGALQLKANAVNSSKVLNGSLLKADFKAGQVPAGLAGPAGSKGDPGPPATALWAIVHSDGSIVSPPALPVSRRPSRRAQASTGSSSTRASPHAQSPSHPRSECAPSPPPIKHSVGPARRLMLS